VTPLAALMAPMVPLLNKAGKAVPAPAPAALVATSTATTTETPPVNAFLITATDTLAAPATVSTVPSSNSTEPIDGRTASSTTAAAVAPTDVTVQVTKPALPQSSSPSALQDDTKTSDSTPHISLTVTTGEPSAARPSSSSVPSSERPSSSTEDKKDTKAPLTSTAASEKDKPKGCCIIM
jgi:hypothetical protein